VCIVVCPVALRVALAMSPFDGQVLKLHGGVQLVAFQDLAIVNLCSKVTVLHVIALLHKFSMHTYT